MEYPWHFLIITAFLTVTVAKNDLLEDLKQNNDKLQLLADLLMGGPLHQLRPTLQITSGKNLDNVEKSNTKAKAKITSMEQESVNLSESLRRSVTEIVTTAEPTEAPTQPTPRRQENNTCCTSMGCYSPCPYPWPMPYMPPMPPMPPMVVPARTVYERVIHNHPPVHKIREFIKSDKKHRSHKYVSGSSSEETDSSDTDTSSAEPDDVVNYYDDVMQVRG